MISDQVAASDLDLFQVSLLGAEPLHVNLDTTQVITTSHRIVIHIVDNKRFISSEVPGTSLQGMSNSTLLTWCHFQMNAQDLQGGHLVICLIHVLSCLSPPEIDFRTYLLGGYPNRHQTVTGIYEKLCQYKYVQVPMWPNHGGLP